MKKEFCALLFVVTFLGCSIISCEYPKSKVSNGQEASPSSLVMQYFNHSLVNDENALNKLITRTPASYWVQCNNGTVSNQKVIEDNLKRETEKKWADGYFELIKSTSKYIKVNNFKLLSIKEERILRNEAVVSADTGNQNENKIMTFFLTREDEKWKIFLVNSDNSEPVKFKFAEERPVCK
jgi:hypothetical protein